MPAAANHLTFTGQPSSTTASSTLTPPITLAVVDRFGNLRSGDNATSVTLTLGGGASGAALFGTATQTTQAGVATFADLSVQTAATGYHLSAASGKLTGADSSPFDIKAAAASKFGVNPDSPVVAGATFAVSVTALDPYNNTDGGYAVTVSLTSDDPAAASLGSFSFTSANGGQYTYQVSLKTAGARTITAGDGKLSGSGGTTVAPAAADHLTFAQAPTDGTAGKTLAAVSVQVLDAFANVVTDATAVTVSLASSNPTGAVLAGTFTVKSSAGVATFSDLTIDRAGTDKLAVKLSGKATPLTSDAFTIAAGTTLIARDDTYQVAIGDTLTLAAPGVLANDSPSPAGSSLTLVEWDEPQALHGRMRLHSNGTFTYTPQAGFTGIDTLNYTVEDDTGASGQATVKIIVGPKDKPPVLTVPAAQTTNQDTSLVFSSAKGNRISVADPDTGSAPLKLTLSVADGKLTLATTAHLTFTAGGNSSASFTVSGAQADLNAALDGLAYVPPADFSGTDTLSLFVNDLGHTGAGAAGTDSKAVALTVNAVNQAPVVKVPAAQGTAQDTALVFSKAAGNALTASDMDAGGATEALTFTATHGSLMLAGGNGLSFTTSTFNGTLANLNAAMDGLTFFPDAGYTGPAAIDVVVNDQGHSGLGGAKSGRGGVLIRVGNSVPLTARPPVGVADSFAALAGVPLRLTYPNSVLDNDTFAAGSFGRTAVLASAAPGHGSFAFSSDGTISYVPDATFTGTVSFQYRPQDSVGLGALTTVTIQVGNQVNQAALTVTPDGKTVTLSAPAGVALSDVRTVAALAPAPASFPLPAFQFDAAVGKPGAATTVTLPLPAGVTVNHYFMYGHVPGDAASSAAHWYAFDYDGHTGAEIHGQTVTLHFIDGQRGDDDRTANGVVVDPGAPAFARAVATIPATRGVAPWALLGGLTADEIDRFFGVPSPLRGRRFGH